MTKRLPPSPREGGREGASEGEMRRGEPRARTHTDTHAITDTLSRNNRDALTMTDTCSWRTAHTIQTYSTDTHNTNVQAAGLEQSCHAHRCGMTEQSCHGATTDVACTHRQMTDDR